MALTATVTKVIVISSVIDEFQITAHLKVNDGVSDVIDQDFSVRYIKRNNLDSVSDAENRLKKEMQKVINSYKSSQVVFNSAALNNAITNIQNSLVM